jgi:CubicO group peptidase (beta-lactamase class C family)
VSGETYARYMRTHIFAPLGMMSARIMVRVEDTAGVAAPYALDDGKTTRMIYEWYATPPASSAAMSLNDMAKLLLDLAAAKPRLLKRATLDDMMRQHSQIHPEIPGWGYGFQLDRVNGHRIAEHGGDIGGFAGLLSILPDDQLAIYVVNHGEGSSLRFRVRDAVIKALLPATTAPAPARVAVDVKPYLGKYRAAFQCHTCAEAGNSPEFEVGTDGRGNLTLWGSTWVSLGNDLFVDAEDADKRIAFLRNAAGQVTVVGGSAWRVGERVTN